jgi:general secretion pathway protein H
MRYQKGFTLVELIVVLLIIGLMLALVGPKITSGLGSVNLKSTARKIATTLRYARGQAVAKKTPHEVFFDNEKGMYGIGEIPLQKDQEPLFKQIKLPEEITLKEKSSITFYSNGSSSGGKIIITNNKSRDYLIGVNMITGLVRISNDEDTRR